MPASVARITRKRQTCISGFRTAGVRCAADSRNGHSGLVPVATARSQCGLKIVPRDSRVMSMSWRTLFCSCAVEDRTYHTGKMASARSCPPLSTTIWSILLFDKSRGRIARIMMTVTSGLARQESFLPVTRAWQERHFIKCERPSHRLEHQQPDCDHV